MLYEISDLLQKGLLGVPMKPNWSEYKIMYIMFKNSPCLKTRGALCLPLKPNTQVSPLKYHPKFLFCFVLFLTELDSYECISKNLRF